MLSSNEVLSLTRRVLDNSIGAVGSDTRWDTTRMLDQYHGRPYGTEVSGRSKIVTRDILEVIEWAMPSLMRVFASGERVVMFTPNGAEDLQQAEQETDYVNHCFLQDSNGWDVLYQWFHSALLERNAYVKVYWDDQRRTRVTQYEGLNAVQMQLVTQGIDPLMQAPFKVPTGYKWESAEIIEAEARIVVEPMSGMEVEVFDVKVREVMTRGLARVEYVPREEMRISKDARDLNLDNVEMTAHVRWVTRSDLLLMGYDRDIVEALPTDKSTDLASNTTQYARQTERSSQRTEYQAPDESTELIQINECYIRLDVDEDGISELRRVVFVGDELLDNEEIDAQPFVSLCPIPQPAAHIGMGLGDLTEDIQLIKTHLLRSVLDNLALTNNPEKEVVWDNVEFPDDLETSVVGGIKRVTQSGSISPLVVPFTAGASVPIMELLDQMKEGRTGISRNTMGLDADTLSSSTMGAFAMGLQQANQRLEMIARTFAETGMTWLFQKLRGLITKHQDAPRTVRLRGQFVDVDPRTWDDRVDTTAMVGLGTGQQGQTLAYLAQIAEKQEQHMLQGSPMVGYEELWQSYERMVEAAGFHDASMFFARPDSGQFQQRAQASADQAQQGQQATADAMQAQLGVAMAEISSKHEQAMAKLMSDQEQAVGKLTAEMTKFFEENQRKWAELELDNRYDVPGKGIELNG